MRHDVAKTKRAFRNGGNSFRTGWASGDDRAKLAAVVADVEHRLPYGTDKDFYIMTAPLPKGTRIAVSFSLNLPAAATDTEVLAWLRFHLLETGSLRKSDICEFSLNAQNVSFEVDE